MSWKKIIFSKFPCNTEYSHFFCLTKHNGKVIHFRENLFFFPRAFGYRLTLHYTDCLFLICSIVFGLKLKLLLETKVWGLFHTLYGVRKKGNPKTMRIIVFHFIFRKWKKNFTSNILQNRFEWKVFHLHFQWWISARHASIIINVFSTQEFISTQWNEIYSILQL